MEGRRGYGIFDDKINLKIPTSGVSNKKSTSALSGKIVLRNTDVSTPSGAIVKVSTVVVGERSV